MASSLEQRSYSPDTTAELGESTPTRVRFGVLAFLGAMTFVLYLDRVCIGQAATTIQSELGISNTHWGFILAAFTLSYGLFEVPAGRLGDRFGARGVLTRIVVWWSAFTALTGAAFGFWSLLVVRFLFGAGEAGALPNAARILFRWFPESSRGTAQGTVTTCMMVGGATAPMTAAALIQNVGWRWTFLMFGCVGLVWAVAFRLWFRDAPEEHPAVNAAELTLIAGDRKVAPMTLENAHSDIPWRAVLTNRNVWLMGALMTCNSSVYYMLISWYPNYLQQGRGLEPMYAGRLASFVLAGGVAGCFLGGTLLDRLISWTNNRRWSRCGLGCVSLALGSTALFCGVRADSPVTSAALISLACFCLQVQIPAWWSTVTQISGRHIGSMFGLMNSMGIPGATASQLLPGTLADYLKRQGYVGRDQWDPGLLLYSGVLAIAIFLWLFVNPVYSLEEDQLEA